MQAKIERLTGRSISLVLDENDSDRMEVEPRDATPRVVVGSAALKYPGFARMCVEYATASIRLGRPISRLEFHMALGRN